ncbi:MAG: 3-oxoacyl-[acyl-carrier-protein] reductase [Acidimicrobiia bacterium]|nr:3-oxoacyl-[acyl-carrier-protein] reductase [Acidimicrobiia bacterium]
MRLQGRKALVTGGSRGIGRAIALGLASEGADVAINYLSKSGPADEVAQAIRGLGRKAVTVQADVSRFESAAGMTAKVIESFGHLDILVNNAGITSDKSFVKMDPDSWRQVLAINLDGVFNCTKTVLDQMIARRYGRIVNITSVIGQIGNFGQANYAASKAGQMAMTKSLAKEVATKGITVNAVAPGFIETEMVETIPEKVRERLIASIPMQRFGQASDVARAVVYLVSSDADYITGTELSINGGLFM